MWTWELLFLGNSTDGGLSEDEDTIPVSDGGQLSFRFSNGQVDTNIQDESAVDYEDKGGLLDYMLFHMSW